MSDGLEDVELERDYGPHKAGETIRVGLKRKAWMDENLRSPRASLAARVVVHAPDDGAPSATAPVVASEEVADA